MDDLRVFPRHVRSLKLCLVPGARDWMKHHGFEWHEFVRKGIPASELLATGDTFAARAVEQARAEQWSKK